MAEIHDSERLIRPVPRDTGPRRKSERQVIIDVKHGRVVDKVGLLDFWREFKYFIVSNTDDPGNEASGLINLTYGGGSDGNRLLNIDLNYKAWCPPGKEKQVVKSLYHGDDPGEVLSGLVSKWALENISSQNGSFAISNSESISFLEAAIRAKAQMETGLTMDVEFSIKSYPPWPTRITDSFMVRAKGYDKEETLNVVVEIDVIENNSLSAIQYSDEALRQLVRAGLQDYFAHNVSLHQFYFNLNDQAFNYLVTQHLDDILTPGGCKVTFLSLERYQQAGLPPRSYKAQVSIICEMDGGASPVTIKNSVLMDLHDVARYFASGSPDLNVWVENELKKLINNELIGLEYTDLVMNFQPLVEKIEQNLRLAVPGVGYELRHLKSTPDIEIYRWLYGLEIKIDDSEGEFETSLAKFFVKLSASLTVRVKDLNGIRDYLGRQLYVPDLMKKALVNTTRRFVRETHPAKFYSRFSQAGATSKPIFEDELKAKISKMLDQRFNAEIIEVIFELGETEFTNALHDLMSKRCDFKVPVPPSRKTQEECVFKGNFKVSGVDPDGWEDFRSTLPDMDQVRERLEGGIKTALENHPTALMKFRDTLSISQIEGIVRDAAQTTILNDYGLRITVTNIGSDATQSEKEIAKNATAVQTRSVAKELEQYFSNIALITEQIRTLEQQIIMIEVRGGPQEDIGKLQQRIETLKQYSTIEPIASGLCYKFQKES